MAELKEKELANQRRDEAERKRADDEARQKRDEAELRLKRQREAEALKRQEKDRQNQAEIAAQQRKRDSSEASEPYTPWLAFGCLVIAIALIVWVSRVFAK